MPPMTTHRLLTEADVADQLAVAPRTVRTYRHDDPTFPQPIRLSAGCIRWRQLDLDRWIASKQETPTPTPARRGRQVVA